MRHLIIKNFWGEDKDLFWNEDGMFQKEGSDPFVPSMLMFSKLMFFFIHRILHVKQWTVNQYFEE